MKIFFRKQSLIKKTSFRLNIYLLLLFLSSTCTLGGELVDYLKKAEGKVGNHSIRNIDFIYIINLDKRPEKYALCLHQLEPYGINPYRFSAINGWELPLKVINNVGIRGLTHFDFFLKGTVFKENDTHSNEIISSAHKTYYAQGMKKAHIGIVLSHISVLQDAYESGYETIWVMEDDILVHENPNSLSEYIEELDDSVGSKNWDILFTDPDTVDRTGTTIPCRSYHPKPNFTPKNPSRFSVQENISPIFRKIGARYGAYSMIIRRSGLKKLLDYFHATQVFMPYDMEYFMPDDIQLYVIRHDVISTIPDALTDNLKPGYAD